MKNDERFNALKILLSLLQENKPLSQLFQVNPNVSPLCKEICFGVCRHYFRLEAFAHALIKKQPKSQDIWLCILIGLYQLHFLNKADYAVVKETVNLLERIKKPWAKGLVNAVLRNFCRERENLIQQLQTNPSFVYGHPHWFVKRVQADWPLYWESLLRTNDKHPPLNLRVNQRQTNRQAYIDRLSKAGIPGFSLPHSEAGIQLNRPCEVSDLPEFSSGAVSVQDESAQLAISLLDLKPGLRVLDACSAPGGKTGHILETEAGLKACVALDVSKRRLKRVEENLARLGLQHHAMLIQGDALEPEKWWDGELFDRILLDAPCSATGIIRRQPDLKLLRTEAGIENAVKLQAQLLHSLWPLLKPGGRMVYATCSVIPEENSQQILNFSNQVNQCEVLQMDQAWGIKTGYGWQILPQTEQGGDGFFYSVLLKTE